MAPSRRPPPRHLAELTVRAEALVGRTVGELGAALGVPLDGPAVRTKGLTGQLVERALGATAGSSARPDFPHLGVELKTVPVDAHGGPRESTFVCSIRLWEADRAVWETSSARAKLAHVLFVPVYADGPIAHRRIGRPRFFRPSTEQEAVLRADFDELMGEIGAGGAESVTARRGRWLQVRPKAAHGAVRTLAPGALADDGAWVSTGPRGFYLRRTFVASILARPT